MRNFTIYLAFAVCLLASKLTAQESFEYKARIIAEKIENITKEEKASLKKEVEEVNKELENGSINTQQSDEKKINLAESRAKNIETRVALEEAKLSALVKEKVDGKLKENDTIKGRYSFSIPGFKIKDNNKRDLESRTTSQFIFAGGFNNLVTDGSVANSDFRYLRSVFYEWGLTYNSRLLKNNNLLHLKYGVTWVYNILSATDNRYFVENGDQTVLQTFPVNLKNNRTYFKNVFVTVPVFLEFDFSKNETRDGKKVFKIQKGFRLGVGGFVGYNTNSKQFLAYNSDGHKIEERQKGNWNINDWNYGLSAYFGYKNKSLYLKYDLNPMFKDNVVKQNNISLGVRFDLN
jgi:hypothetical protein